MSGKKSVSSTSIVARDDVTVLPPSVSSDAVPSSSKPAKRRRLHDKTHHHAPNCRDLECSGCDVGQVEISFVAESGSEDERATNEGAAEGSSAVPTPEELYRMALEEAAREPSEEHAGGLAKRLFDMALEGFEDRLTKLQAGVEPTRENTTRSLDSKLMSRDETTVYLTIAGRSDSTGDILADAQFRCACCYVAFGRYLPLAGHVRKGCELFGLALRHDSGRHDAWIALGSARAFLAQLAMHKDEGDDDGDDGDCDDDADGKTITSEAALLYDGAVEAFDKGLAILADRDPGRLPYASARAAKDLLEYGIDAFRSRHRERARIIFEQALRYLDRKFEASLESGLVNGVRGSCLYNLARLSSTADTAGAKNLLDEAIASLRTARESLQGNRESTGEDDAYVEVLGQAYILKSTFDVADVEAVEAFDLGIDCLREAYKQRPDNGGLREQLEALGALSECDEENVYGNEETGSEGGSGDNAEVYSKDDKLNL